MADESGFMWSERMIQAVDDLHDTTKLATWTLKALESIELTGSYSDQRDSAAREIKEAIEKLGRAMTTAESLI